MAAAPPSASSASSAASYMALANGSDIRGVASGPRATLTPEKAYFIAEAFVRRCAPGPTPPQRLCVGLDPRTSGPALAAAAAAGMRAGGAAEVLDGTLATTPSVFMATRLLGVAGGIMLTASHLPGDRNGMKFFTAAGGLAKGDIRAILEAAAAAHDAADAREGGAPALVGAAVSRVEMTQPHSIMPAYAAHLRECILRSCGGGDPRPLRGMHIVVDAGNGSGGFFVREVLEPLGADTAGSQLLEPDGSFPVHAPNPEDAAAMRSASAAVTAAGADLGIVFDTDVDRCAVVAGDGTPVNRNRLIAAVADIALREHPGTTIVTDSVTSAGLAGFIEARGGRHLRYMRGYKNVIDKGVQLNAEGRDAQVMIETSGHGALKENYFLDDGCYLAVKIISELARRRAADGARADVRALYEGLREPGDELEMRLPIRESADFRASGERAIRALEAWVAGRLPFAPPPPGWTLEAENYEGVRINISGGLVVEDGWLLLRQSLHDPLLVLNAETGQANGCAHVATTLAIFLEAGGKDLPGWRDVDAAKVKEAARAVERGGHPISPRDG